MSELKFLAMSDLEGRHDLVKKLLEADLSKYDMLLYKGDTPDPQVYKKIRRAMTLSGDQWSARTSTGIYAEHEESQKAFKKSVEDSTIINNLFGEIKKKLPIYGVLGNSDTVPTMIAPKIGMEAVDFGKYINLVHNKIEQFKGFTLVGYNGRVRYLDEEIVEAPQLSFLEEKALEDLHKLFKQVDPAKTIFVTHAPPYGILDKVAPEWVSYGVGTYGEKAKDGHIGANAFRTIAFEYQPLVHTFGHIHETPGVEKHGRTTFINGGAMGETEEMEEVTIKDGNVSNRWVKISDL
ncbi:MAG: metallophosphoesterase [Deltaproteobacteria bacterium]|nr:metallophosphoesterase [Deltaproteobacteria bacterium]